MCNVLERLEARRKEQCVTQIFENFKVTGWVNPGTIYQINELPAHDKAGSWRESMEGETLDFTATPHVGWKCGRVKSLEVVKAFKQ
jgi:hypothetical protein